jgi:hypothetical protein
MYTLTCFDNDPQTFLSLEVAHSAEGLHHSKPSLVFFKTALEPIVIGRTDCSSVINPLAEGIALRFVLKHKHPAATLLLRMKVFFLYFIFLSLQKMIKKGVLLGSFCIGVFLQLNCKSVLTCFDL